MNRNAVQLAWILRFGMRLEKRGFPVTTEKVASIWIRRYGKTWGKFH